MDQKLTTPSIFDFFYKATALSSSLAQKILNRLVRPSTILSLIIYAALSTQLSGQTFQDDSLKANYLINFIDFVRWDESRNDEKTIAVIGSHSVYTYLKQQAATTSVSGGKLEILEISNTDSIDEVDIIYFGENQSGNLASIISQAKKNAILTVGEDHGFIEAGGLIEFQRVDNRLLFKINTKHSKEYKLEMSAKLTRLSAE